MTTPPVAITSEFQAEGRRKDYHSFPMVYIRTELLPRPLLESLQRWQIFFLGILLSWTKAELYTILTDLKQAKYYSSKIFSWGVTYTIKNSKFYGLVNFYICACPCKHHPNQDRVHSQHLRRLPCALSQTHSPNHSSDLCHHRVLLHVLELHINGIMWYVLLCLTSFARLNICYFQFFSKYWHTYSNMQSLEAIM